MNIHSYVHKYAYKHICSYIYKYEYFYIYTFLCLYINTFMYIDGYEYNHDLYICMKLIKYANVDIC
jgi:hypothetical protein